MMRKSVFIGLWLVSAMLVKTATGQQCKNFHKQCEKSEDSSFLINMQSRTALFVKGEPSEMKIVAYSGKDYRISICAESDFSSGVYFRIKDGRKGKVLFDNAADENIPQSFEFSSIATRTLIIEVLVPEQFGEDDPEFMLEMGCVGVLIEGMYTPETGF